MKNEPIHLPQALHVGACAVYPYSPELEAAFDRVDRFGEPYNWSVRDGVHLHVPRNCAPEPLDGRDKRVARPPWPALKCKLPPKDEEQAEVIDRSYDYLSMGDSHIVEAPTGYGKTYVGSAVAARMRQPTLIVVTKNDLMDEWHNTLVNLIGVDPKLIGKAQQGTCTYEGKRFVLGMIHSLVKGNYPPEFYSYFGTLVLDEVHLMGADTFVRACQMVPARYRLGLSATPDRGDGKMDMVKAHVGPILVRGQTVPMTPKIIVRKTGWLMPRTTVKRADGSYEEVPIPHQPGKMMHILKIMAKNHGRNKMIAEFVERAYVKGRRTLVLSDLTDHLEALHLAIAKAGVPGENIDYYIGGKSKVGLDIAKNKPVILATYKMAEYGTNVPIWDTLVFGTPKSKIKQSLGRILRAMDGKLEPVALDLVDADAVFLGQYKSREFEYYQLKAVIKKL